MRILLASLAFLPLLASAAAPSKAIDSTAEFRAAGALAMQADMKSALPHLLRVRADDLTPERRGVYACMRARFVDKQGAAIPPDLDSWTTSVLALYRRYWTRVMLGAIDKDAGERELTSALAEKVTRDKPLHDMGEIEPLLQQKLEARGYHALFGVTAPLREFMLWRKQTDETYDIDLPEGREAVHVTMMDDFASLGWLGYAVCDFHHTGGWATPERLFAVRSGYDLDSESFKVSYLAHEGQHFSDYRRFPGLEQPELEYRAKLVEISKARTSLYDLLGAFVADGADTRETPHPWANRQVVKALAGKLLNGEPPSDAAFRRIPIEKLNATAAELLQEDSKRLAAARTR